MRRAATISLLVAMAWAAAGARADEVQLVRGVPYSKIKITGFQDFKVVFRMSSGQAVEKPLREIRFIKIDGQNDFNKAEEHLKKNKAKDALKAYDQAAKRARGWLKGLVLCRRLGALDRAGPIDKAVKEWLGILAQARKQAAAAFALRPANFPKRGDKATKAAISLLEDTLGKVTDKAFEEVIRQLLLELYQHEKMTDKAAALAKAIADEPKPEPTPPEPSNGGQHNGPPPVAPPAAPPSRMQRKLEAFEVRLDSGKATDAELRGFVTDFSSNRSQYRFPHLPTAMLLTGRSQVMLHDRAGGKDRDLLLQAGLNFMRVATFFGASARAPQALYLAGDVNRKLGNTPAARAAYKAVIDRYQNSRFAEVARKALEDLSKA